MAITKANRLTAAGGVLLTAMLAAWLVPPTTPKTIDGSRPVPARPVATRAPAAAADEPFSATAGVDAGRHTGYEPPVIEQPTPAPAPITTTDDTVSADVDDRPNRDVADDEGYDPDHDPEVAFDTGYRWARRQEVQARRECRRLDDDAARDGCRAYVADLRDDRRREADDRGD